MAMAMRFKFHSHLGIVNWKSEKDPGVKFCAFTYVDCNSSNKLLMAMRLTGNKFPKDETYLNYILYAKLRSIKF